MVAESVDKRRVLVRPHLPLAGSPRKRCAPAIADIWGRGGGGAQDGLSKFLFMSLILQLILSGVKILVLWSKY